MNAHTTGVPPVPALDAQPARRHRPLLVALLSSALVLGALQAGPAAAATDEATAGTTATVEAPAPEVDPATALAPAEDVTPEPSPSVEPTAADGTTAPAAAPTTAATTTAVVPPAETAEPTPLSATTTALAAGDPRYVPVGPVRVHDARSGVLPGTPTCFQVAGGWGVPTGAAGLALNVTTVGPVGPGNVVVYPDTDGTGRTAAPNTATVNFTPGSDVANAAMVALPANGRICYLVRGSRAGIILDVSGYTTAGSGLELRTPVRLEDRSHVAPGIPVTIQVAGRAGVPVGATSVVLNVAAAGSVGPGNLRVYAGGTQRPATSTLNYSRSGDRSNAAVVQLSSAGTLTYYSETGSANAVRVVIDVVGYSMSGSGYGPLTPKRVLDTRTAGALSAGQKLAVPVLSGTGVPANATAVVLNVTGVSPTTQGNLRVYPSGATSVPSTSALNYLPSNDVANMVVSGIGSDGKVSLYTDQFPGGRAHVVVDVVGYMVDDAVRTIAPTPAPTPPPAGTVKPGPTNTGVPAGVTLKPYRGDLVITTPGTVIDGLDIYGFVTIKAANVTIKNSRVRGSGPGSYNTGLINVTHSAVQNAVIQDVTLVPDYPSVWINGVLGHDFTARRVNTWNVVDGFGIFNTTGPAANAVVESSWVHDLSFFSPDPNHSDNKTHNDAIQIQGGTNIRIVGNYLSAYLSKTAGTQNYQYPQAGFGVILTPNVSAVSGSKINNNWLDGSYIPIKLTTGTKGPMNFGEVSYNRFGRDMRNVGYAGKSNYFTILMTPDTTATTVGNVYDDNNAPVTVRRDSGTSTAP